MISFWVGPFREQVCLASVCNHSRVSLIVSGANSVTWDGSQVGGVMVGHSLSLCSFVPIHFVGRTHFGSKILWVGFCPYLKWKLLVSLETQLCQMMFFWGTQVKGCFAEADTGERMFCWRRRVKGCEMFRKGITMTTDGDVTRPMLWFTMHCFATLCCVSLKRRQCEHMCCLESRYLSCKTDGREVHLLLSSDKPVLLACAPSWRKGYLAF